MLLHAFPTRSELREFYPRVLSVNPAVLAAYAVADWLAIAACWFVMATVPHPLVYVAGVLLIGGRFHALGVVLHDACHRTCRHKTLMRYLVEALAGWPIGTTIDAMRYHHLRHHRASCMREDPYRHPLALKGAWVAELMALRGALLPYVWSLRAFCGPIALLWPAFRTGYARFFLQDRSGKDLRNDPEVIRCAWADLPQAAAHTIAAIVIVKLQLPFVADYLIPWMLGGVMNARRVIREHDLVEVADQRPMTVWASTRTHTSWLGRLLLYPHNIGYHQVHHLYPSMPFGQLPAAHAKLLDRIR